jgi:hypothetical protein
MDADQEEAADDFAFQPAASFDFSVKQVFSARSISKSSRCSPDAPHPRAPARCVTFL